MRINYIPSGFVATSFGYHYNGYTVIDTRNIANTGWHVPTAAEFAALGTYLGGDAVAGGAMKRTDTIWFGTPNTGATNSSGFGGKGCGYRATTGSYLNMLADVFYWCSDGWSTYLYNRRLSSTSASLLGAGSGLPRNYGASIRLLCDSSTNPGYYLGNDGIRYKTVSIGTQVWVLDCICETKYRNGDTIDVIADSTAWAAATSAARCVFDNNEMFR